ncbi:hypothetical protein M3Y95_00393100 [Aphelenchoides besseyi]|nr:hypothetical protein M3Y95_00393100 [Aphelenchoides besseyi]
MGVTVFALVILLLVYFYRSIYERLRLIWYVDRLPGPICLPIFGVTWQLKWKINEFTPQLYKWLYYYKDRNLKVIRVWIGPFPMICLLSVESIKTVLESNNVIRKGDEYSIIERWLGQGLLISRGDKWRNRRKMLTPAFHFNMLNKFQAIFDKEAQILVEQLKPFAESDELFDASSFLKRCALDIICETSMGVKVNAQIEHDHPYVHAVKRMNELSFTYARMPWLWIKPIWYLLGYGKEYDENLKLVTDFTRQVIANRRKTFKPIDFQDNKRQYAFLDLLLDVQTTGGLTDEDIREETDTFMFETIIILLLTSSGLVWTLWLLAHYPNYQQKIFEELDQVFGESNRNCTSENLKQLRYLEQCIKESLRLFPPVPFFTRKVEEDIDCVGFKIPRGATFLIAPNCVSEDKQVCASRHPFAFIPFSAGPRNCIGQKFALMEEKTVLSWFFRRYELTTHIPLDANPPCPEIISRPFLGLPVRIHKRQPNNDR